MAMFIVRVELHGAMGTDYEVLHKAMRAEGFVQTITAQKGGVFHLPTAEYQRIAFETKAEALVKSQRAAAKTGKRHGILVTESNGTTWFGLDVVKQSISR
jgi:hypothetical protein